MHPIIRTANVILVIAFVIIALLFVHAAVTESGAASVTTIMRIGYGLVIVAIFVNVAAMYLAVRKARTVNEITKRCVSCGLKMNINEFSCPKCRTLQPEMNEK